MDWIFSAFVIYRVYIVHTLKQIAMFTHLGMVCDAHKCNMRMCMEIGNTRKTIRLALSYGNNGQNKNGENNVNLCCVRMCNSVDCKHKKCVAVYVW